MNKSQRIYLSTGDTGNQNTDKYIKVKLEQDTETIEFMTLKIGTTDAYQNFNSDYGVLVGRVIANDGIGIPNAKISIFVPLDDNDANNSDIVSIYPYKSPRDKNNDGKRYNLLPRVSRPDPNTGIISPKQPFGSFPLKEEVLGNESILKVYKKYYKYTTVTNGSGDYMIYGVPVGTQTVHLSIDITDIGEYSMTPASMVTNLGYSENLFTDDRTKIKVSKDLDDLPNIETQEISVDIIPFWGDIENFEIGITRQDFRIRSVLKNTFIIFGSVFTDGDRVGWGYSCSDSNSCVSLMYTMKNGLDDVGIATKRVGRVTEKIYYYPPNISDADIDSGNYVDKMLLLEPSEYSIYKKDGDFILIISSNRDKIIINDSGEKVPVDNDFAGGLFTTFRGFMTLEITRDDLNLDWEHIGKSNQKWKPIREKLKFPQMADWHKSFRVERVASDKNDSDAWRRQHYCFCGGCIYSIARFVGTTRNGEDKARLCNGYIQYDKWNHAQYDARFNTGVIVSSNISATSPDNESYEYPSNACVSSSYKVFGANWMNISVYLQQMHYISNGYCDMKIDGNSNYFRHHGGFAYCPQCNDYFAGNNQLIAGQYCDTVYMSRSDYHWTDFIEVPKEDIQNLNLSKCKGITTGNNNKNFTRIDGQTATLNGKYRNGYETPLGEIITWACAAPKGGAKCCGSCGCATSDKHSYIYKGFCDSDVVKYMVDLGLA